MKGSDWILLDTETDGLFEPIHIVEVCAQRMRGWEPAGNPFQSYLNHRVRIPLDAVAVHGLTTEFISKNGREPGMVHDELHGFIGTLPVVSHNLSYDWDRCLLPEWSRLRKPVAGKRGFCSVLLARRALPEVKSVRLETLRQTFGISVGRTHSASGDVATLADMFQQIIGPRLANAGIDSFDQVAKFSRMTPLKKCHALLGKRSQNPPRPNNHPTVPPARLS